MEEEKWILYDDNSKKYFRKWTGIGPSCTSDISEAEVFGSKQEAMQSPAFTFSMTFFEPKQV